MAESKDKQEKNAPSAEEALDSFLSREQGGDKKPVKNGKINKRVLIIIIAVVIVAGLVALLIFTRNASAPKVNEDEIAEPADISLDVNADGEHTAKVAVHQDGSIKENGSGNLLNYVPADISRIDVENTNGSFAVTSNTPEGEATVYTLVGYEDYGLQEGVADEVATDASSVEFTKIISPDGNLPDYGLDKPRAKVKVAYQDKTTATIRVGNEAPGAEGTYIAFGSSNAVYLVANESVDAFMYSVNQFINRAVTDTNEDSDTAEFSELTITGSRYDDPITLKPNKDEAVDAVYLVTEPRKMYANAVESYDIAGAVRGLYADEVICVNPSDGQLESFGLADPYAEVNATYPDAKITLMASAADDSGNSYIFNPDKNIVYKMQSAALSWAHTSVEALVPQYIFAVKIAAVSKIEFNADDESYTFDVSTTTELQDDEEGNTQDVTVTKAVCDGKTLDENNFLVFFQNLNDIENTGDVGSGSGEVMSFTYSYNTGRDNDTVTVYSTGSAKYAVALNGDIIGSASKSYIDGLMKNPAALIKGEPVTNLM